VISDNLKSLILDWLLKDIKSIKIEEDLMKTLNKFLTTDEQIMIKKRFLNFCRKKKVK